MRCAIYTRKSSADGLEGDFTSLDNQREYCSAYIKSQQGEGWIELPERYNDGGISGGTLTRPALTQLRADVADGKIDMVVVYKIDRLSRSLRDFVNLVAEFEASGVTFVAVTQSFNTANAMGRLTLNVLLSFAQFERELTGERLRDWYSGARARGYWTNRRPFGYQVIDKRHLVVDPVEADVIRRIFRRYCVLKSSRRVADELFRDGIRQVSGRPWSTPTIIHTIKNRLYIGELMYRKSWLPGVHEAIVSEALWRKTQEAYSDNKWTRRSKVEQPVMAMLAGIIHDRTGERMHHTFLHSKGRLYRYYVAGSERRRYGGTADAYMRFRAADLERSVVEVVDRMTGHQPARRDRGQTTELVRRHVARIDIDYDEMRVQFRLGATVIAQPEGRLGPRVKHRRTRVTSPTE